MKNRKLSFSVDKIEEVKREIDETQFSLLKVAAFSTQPSLHDTFVTEETLKRTAKSILLKPFVFVVDERFGDLGGHDSKEVPGGFVPADSPLEFYHDEKGNLWLSCEVLVWKRYSGKLLEYFERDNKKKGVSVEIEIFESKEDEKTGLLELLEYTFQAITCLGDFITPAIPNAQAIMQFSEEYEKAVELEFGSKYEEIDFTIPQSVKKTIKKALEEKRGSSVSLALARYLLSNEKATPDRIRQMVKYFKRKNISEEDISFNLFGGKSGRKWSLELGKTLDQIDEKRLSYFANEENTDENENSQNSDEETVVDNYLGIDRENEENTEGGQENNMAEKDEKDKEVVEEKEFNYAELFADEKFAEMFAEVEEDEEEEEREDDEKEKYAKAKEEFASGKNPAAVMSAMYSALKRMSKRFAAMKEKMAKKDEDNKVYLAENEDLKKRFAEQEEKEKEMAIDSFMKDMSEKVEMSEEQANEMKEKAKEYSFAKLNDWKNEVKAFAFDFKPKKQNEEDKSIVTYALPFGNFETPQTTNVWDNLSK